MPEWYLTVGSKSPESECSQPPTYAAQVVPGVNTKLQ